MNARSRPCGARARFSPLLGLALLACGPPEPAAGPETPVERRSSTVGPARVAEPPPPLSTPAVPEATGRYTSLEGCELLELQRDEGGYSVHRCPGEAGYWLKRTEADGRQDLALAARDGREHGLNLPGMVGGGFSTLGPRVEWRGPGGRPSAMIVRYAVVEDPAAPERPTSYLAVARLGPGAPCVIGKVPPGPGQNAAARRLAEAGGPCLPAPA